MDANIKRKEVLNVPIFDLCLNPNLPVNNMKKSLLIVVCLFFFGPSWSAMYEVPKVDDNPWYDYGYASGKLSMPPSGNGRIDDWHATWPGYPDMYLSPSECSSVGQSLRIMCPNGACSGGFRCRKDSISDLPCPANSVEVDGKCYREENDPCSGENVGNPCNPATGNKHQRELDFSVAELSIDRIYNSIHQRDTGFGPGWTVPFSKKLVIVGTTVGVEGATGKTEAFSLVSGQWQADQDSRITLTENSIGFLLTREDGSSEKYDHLGQLVSESSPARETMSYKRNTLQQLIEIQDYFGKKLSITWNALNHISAISDPAGNVYQYFYDGLNNLVRVQYPDRTEKEYHYENTGFPHHLTGITDENGVRYASFYYDARGRAISTEHADIGGGGGQEKFQIDYGQ
jgi:YD repeat-containing protein